MISRISSEGNLHKTTSIGVYTLLIAKLGSHTVLVFGWLEVSVACAVGLLSRCETVRFPEDFSMTTFGCLVAL